MSGKTVFISYRRETGSGFAHAIAGPLKNEGYDVYLDVKTNEAGEWAAQILTQVPQRAHFLLLLTPGALDRCDDPDDWVRREFELALLNRRNIVPVCEGSFDLTAARGTCPPSMTRLFDFQTAIVRYEAFDRDLEDLVRHRIPPHKAPPKAPAETSPRVAVSRLRHTADRLFGRDAELAALDAAWADSKIHVVTLVAWGGVGKTSLVTKWVANLATRDLDGADYFDWSFYSQGSSDRSNASADPFIDAALRFFGDEATADSAKSPWDKGARLAQLVGARRTLLVLDGLEPLQHPPGPLAGELKDPAITALLKGLAARNAGLCVVTTRERVENLAGFEGTTAPRWELERLSTTAGVELLKSLGVHGAAADLAKLVEEVRGHALSLSLLGRYLHGAHGGDVRRRDLFPFKEADARIRGGHAFRVMEAYERWLAPKEGIVKRLVRLVRRTERPGSPEGRQQLAILRLLGLFDRPAAADLLAVLRRPPAIPGLTDALAGLSDPEWNLAVTRLAESGLAVPDGGTLDAHPLVREHFGRRLRERSQEAWQAAHGRLFDHLKDSTEHWPDTLEGLQPLYQAIFHGCLAGRQQEAGVDVYISRILRGTGNDGYFSLSKLGAFGADLAAVACFFDPPWSRVSPALTEANQAWLLNQAAFCLRPLGRLAEAVEPTRVGLRMRIDQQVWTSAARIANNLSELELTLGDVACAVRDAEQAVVYADRSGDGFLRSVMRTVLAEALHQAGHRENAAARFCEAETMQAERQPEYPLLYSLRGFQYCDLLLARAERAAGGGPEDRSTGEACDEGERRAAGAQRAWREVFPNAPSVLDTALDHLTLGRARLYRAILTGSAAGAAEAEIDQAVDDLHRAGTQHMLPLGLLTRAWLRSTQNRPEDARADLDEAQEIAERGPMPLHLADVHLYRARLFHDRAALAEVRRLVEKHGYLRRREELEDLEKAAAGWRPEEAAAVDLKALIESAPLEGIDLTRRKDLPRDVEL